MPGRRDRFEALVDSAIEALPETVTYPLLITADNLGIEPSDFVFYIIIVFGIGSALIMAYLEWRKDPDETV